VTTQVFGFSTRHYQVSTEIYSGPLDLLLQLIERAELDITRLSLAKVTDQYLEHLRLIHERDPIEVSDFLVLAARLVLIKSLVLLPKSEPLESPSEEDPGDLLARQLIQYKKVKQAALWLQEREAAQLHTYLRMAPLPKIKERLDLSNISASDLAHLLSAMLANKKEPHPLDQVVTITTITLREKIKSIMDTFKMATKSSFRGLLNTESTRLEIIVTFLALLELIKLHTIQARQEDLFSDISLKCVGEWSEEIETEF